MEWSRCASTLFSPSQFLVLWSYNISSPPSSPWQHHIAFSPSSFFKVTFFPQPLFSLGNRHHLSLSVILAPRLLQLPSTKPNYLIIFSHFSLSPIASPFKPTVTDTTGAPSNLSLSVCFCLFIRLSALLLWCYVSLPCLQRPRPCAHVSQFRGHPALTSRLAHWLHQLTYGAHIWASSIRDGWPEGASAETKPAHRRLTSC